MLVLDTQFYIPGLKSCTRGIESIYSFSFEDNKECETQKDQSETRETSRQQSDW